MKTTTFIILLLTGFALSGNIQAQKYATKTGSIRFYSEAPADNIEAFNKQVNSALDTQTGDFVYRVLMKGFQFEKALMQEHFNENYVESHKFPNASFAGKITNTDAVDFAKDGTYEVTVAGKLTIKGVTKDVSEKGTFEVKDGAINGKSTFNIKLADYGVEIPKTVMKNIAETVEINVDVTLAALNN